MGRFPTVDCGCNDVKPRKMERFKTLSFSLFLWFIVVRNKMTVGAIIPLTTRWSHRP